MKILKTALIFVLGFALAFILERNYFNTQAISIPLLESVNQTTGQISWKLKTCYPNEEPEKCVNDVRATLNGFIEFVIRYEKTAQRLVTPIYRTYATALCRDGTYSFSQSRQGTCSHHGGVAVWF